MSEAQTPLPQDHPLMRAWKAYQSTDEYSNTAKWAQYPEHTTGSLWAAFVAGYKAGAIGAATVAIFTEDEKANT